jgi:uncharacterized protein (DUF849 family)
VDPLVITVAPVGGEPTREQQPDLPLTPEEIAAETGGATASPEQAQEVVGISGGNG